MLSYFCWYKFEVLRDNPNVIRLYCYAPLKDCMERERALSGLDDDEIIRKIGRIDRKTHRYLCREPFSLP